MTAVVESTRVRTARQRAVVRSPANAGKLIGDDSTVLWRGGKGVRKGNSQDLGSMGRHNNHNNNTTLVYHLTYLLILP